LAAPAARKTRRQWLVCISARAQAQLVTCNLALQGCAPAASSWEGMKDAGALSSTYWWLEIAVCGPAGRQTNKPQVLGQHWHLCEALLKPMQPAQLGQACTLCNLLAKGWGLGTPWVQPWQ